MEEMIRPPLQKKRFLSLFVLACLCLTSKLVISRVFDLTLSLKVVEHKRFSFFMNKFGIDIKKLKKVLRREESLFLVMMFGAFLNVVQEGQFLSDLGPFRTSNSR